MMGRHDRSRTIGTAVYRPWTDPRTLIRMAAPVLAILALTGPVAADVADEMIPMRDGVRLATRVYLPTEGGPWPTIVARTPYNHLTDVVARPEWVADVLGRGYAYVTQDTRGRHASEGADSVFWTDGWGPLQDGYDTIEWVAAQSWCDGNVGMHGGSARGIVQYLAAGAAPPSLRACVARASVADFYHHGFFQGGGYRESLVEGWFDSVDNEPMRQFYVAHPTRDAFWDQVDVPARAASVTVPILHVGGFYALFGESAIDAFNAIELGGASGAAGHQRLVIGPWTHDGIEQLVQGELTYPGSAWYNVNQTRWRWYDRWLKGVENGVDEEPAVDFCLMGDVDDPGSLGNQWLTADAFPPEGVDVDYYFHVGQGAPGIDGWLRVDPPLPADAGFDNVHDPFDPVPTRGGRNLFLEAGPYDQRVVHDGRDDVILLSTPVLDAAVAVAGPIRARFFAECSTPDTDWCVRLIDVYPDGREMLVTDGILRARYRNGFDSPEAVPPGEPVEYEVDLWSTALVFDPGHRILLAIAGSNHPRFAVNPNTGGPVGDFTGAQTATVRVRADATYPGRLILPVINDILVASTGASDPRPLLAVSANPAPRFTFTLDVPSETAPVVRIHDVGGRALRTLHATRHGEVVTYRWDGRTDDGRRLPHGAYYVRAETVRGARRSVVLLR